MRMPYRIDIAHPPQNAFDILVELGAIDIEAADEALAAILPDALTPEAVMTALGGSEFSVSHAFGRDTGSTWFLKPKPITVGRKEIRLIDSDVFGTGHHPTTALCIEAIEEIVRLERPERMLDVGTGSGILALTALTLGVPEALGVDIDSDALHAAADNARLNNLDRQLELK